MSFSQSKNEKEERVSVSEFPEVAHSYFNGISNQVKHIKFYKETDSVKYSFEAKFKLNKLYYSIEFDTIGNLEDIEIIIKEKRIPKLVFKNMMSFFNSNFDKVHIIKIQAQYTNNSEKSDQQFINETLNNTTKKNDYFEIIAEVKQYRNRKLKEFTFKNNGEFVKSRFVKSEDYQYVLY
jgi:hypothetical protein